MSLLEQEVFGGGQAALEELPVLAIVGRPNVGKSTLFNRLSHARRAIVDNTPGVTRDLNYIQTEWQGHRFVLIDTGGFETDAAPGLEKRVLEQSLLAVEEADLVIFLFDGKAGLNPLDADAVSLLRKVGKSLFYAVNKLDTQPKENDLYEFYSLGVDRVFPLSAEHGLGIPALMQAMVAAFPKRARVAAFTGESRERALAIVGRPNVGKSTLVNRLLGYDRSLVDERPGTTRDALDSPFVWRGMSYTLVDTAGIRRKGRITDRVERYSAIRALRSIDRGNVIVYLLDGSEGVTDQDAQILAYACQRHKGLVLGVNKSDLLPRERGLKERYEKNIQRSLAFVNYAPIVYLSAVTGMGLEELMGHVGAVERVQQRRIRTSTFNRAVRDLMQRSSPPQFCGREVKFYYGTQAGVEPLTFLLFFNYPEGVSPSYQRYLIHGLRSVLALKGAPVRLILRQRSQRGEKPRTDGR